MIENFYTKVKKEKSARNPGFKLHTLELPARILLASPSGTGKTNILLNFLKLSSGTFSKIVICLKSKDEPLYKLLEEESEDIEFFEQGEIPPMSDFDGHTSSLIVFDDLVLEKDQRRIEEYFIRGRKKGITCIYLSQSYFATPKKIRQNCRYIILKRISTLRDLKLILSEYTLSSTEEELLDLYNKATKDFLNFLLIDTQNNKFVQGFGLI